MSKVTGLGASVAEAAAGDVAFVSHQDGNTRYLEEVQDVEPILERNHLLRGMEQKSDWGRHTATIPNVILSRWFHEELDRGNVHLKMFGPEFDQIIQKKLDDPDWKWLRVDK